MSVEETFVGSLFGVSAGKGRIFGEPHQMIVGRLLGLCNVGERFISDTFDKSEVCVC